jgi:hypothetical protein
MLYFAWEVDALSIHWCRRDSLLATEKHPQESFAAIPPKTVRRSRRLAPMKRRPQHFEGPKDMSGEEESAETKTEDEYSPGEYPQPHPYSPCICTFMIVKSRIYSSYYCNGSLIYL